jgi:hypothetical protein
LLIVNILVSKNILFLRQGIPFHIFSKIFAKKGVFLLTLVDRVAAIEDRLIMELIGRMNKFMRLVFVVDGGKFLFFSKAWVSILLYSILRKVNNWLLVFFLNDLLFKRRGLF